MSPTETEESEQCGFDVAAKKPEQYALISFFKELKNKEKPMHWKPRGSACI